MNSSEKLLAQKGNSVTRNLGEEQKQTIPSTTVVSEKDSLPKLEDDKLSFAVDWQMENIQIQLDGRTNVLDFSMRKYNIKPTKQDSASNENSSYISDW
jgi:hypothetical protein